MTDVLNRLKRLISYDTRTNKDAPGKDILDLLKNELEKPLKDHGFDTQILQSNGHFSLLAIKKDKDPSILYSGHVDVVPWDDRWETNPTEMVITKEQGEQVVKGRGVSDMKSGIAALMTALPELVKTESTIIFAITGDEEIGGENGTKIIVDKLVDEDLLPDYVITADAAGMEIITRRRNSFDVYIKSQKFKRKIVGEQIKRTYTSKIISSPTSHAAYFKKEIDTHALKLAAEDMKKEGLYPVDINGSFVKVNVIPNEITVVFVKPDDEGEQYEIDDGLFHLLEFVNDVMEIQFETLAASEYGINSTSNVIEEKDDHWFLQTDIRAMLDKNADELDGALLLILDRIDWKLDLDILKSVGYTATPNDSPLVLATTKLLGELGYNSKPAERGGATDGRFFAEYNIQTIDIGAIGWNVHGANETATVKSISDLVLFFEQSALAINQVYNTKR